MCRRALHRLGYEVLSGTSLRETTAASPARGRRWWIVSARLLLAALPLYWISTKLEWAALWQRSATLNPGLLLAALSLSLPAAMAVAARWRVTLRAYGATSPPPFTELFRLVLIGLYFNVLPGAVAGDALRAYRTRDALSGTVDALTVVFVDRLCGLAGLVVLGAVSVAASSSDGNATLIPAVALGTLLSLALGAFMTAGPALYRRWVQQPPHARLGKLLDGWVRRVPPPVAPRFLLGAVGASLVTQGLAVIQALLVLQALVDVPLGPIAALLPLVVFLSYFPLTPASVGQRELVYVEVLGAAGVSAEAAVTASLVVLGGLLLTASLGGVLYFSEGDARRASTPPAGTRSWPPPPPNDS